MEWIFDNFNIVFGIIFGLGILGFILSLVFMFNPNMRAKLIHNQIKGIKTAADLSKNDIEHLASTVVEIKSNILDKNEAKLKQMADQNANINKDAVQTYVKAVKDGLSQEQMYCKECGSSNAKDAKFCNNCGKKVK